jgi:hypothetical protein
MKKAPQIVTKRIVCKGIRTGKKSALEDFTKSLLAKAIAVGVGTVAELVCAKSFKERFLSVLIGVCMSIVNCSNY